MEFAPCRHLMQPWQCDSQKTCNTTRLKCCACHAKWRWTRPKSAPATKTATHLAKTLQKYCTCHKKRLSTRYKTRLNVTKCHACHGKQSNATIETSKNDCFCTELTIGTAIRPSRGRLRTVANGCGRLRTVANINATSSEHTLNPQTGPPEWNGNHCYEFGKVATRKAKRTHKNEPVYF